MTTAPLDADQQAQIVTWTRQGLPAHEIADRLHVSDRTIHRWRMRLGVGQPNNAHPWTAKEHRQVERMIADGCPLREIARTLNIPRSSLQRHYRYRGWTPSQSGAWSAEQRRMTALGAGL